MNILVLFYSYEGNTAMVAETIADYYHGDIIRLTPVKEMTSTGFSKYFWGGKQVFMKECPPLEPFNEDYAKYDYVFVGSPVWSWSYAPAIRTLFENNHLAGKKVYFFTTSEGGNKGVEAKAKQLIGRSNQWMGYRDFTNVLKNKELKIKETRDWLQALDLK